MVDYDKVSVTNTDYVRIKTANNDQSQQVHGKTNLHLSVINDKGDRIALKVPFFVVSGLVHDIFIGQTLLASDNKVKETNDYLYISPNPLDSKSRVHRIKKSYKTNKNARTFQKAVVPPYSTLIVETDLLFPQEGPDKLNYFVPADSFHKNHKGLHVMTQTLYPSKHHRRIEVFVVNPTSMPITIRKTHKNRKIFDSL